MWNLYICEIGMYIITCDYCPIATGTSRGLYKWQCASHRLWIIAIVQIRVLFFSIYQPYHLVMIASERENKAEIYQWLLMRSKPNIKSFV